MAKSFSVFQIARAYGRSRFLRLKVALKLAIDPLFETAWKFIVLRGAPVVEIGCGLGLLGITMRAAGLVERYRGSDTSVWKINKAKQAMRYFGFEEVGYEVNDALSTQIPAGATVCLFDSLHLLPPDEQESLLDRLAGAAESGSLVLIRTAFRNSGLRYYSTLLKEYLTRPGFWIRGGVIFFPERGELLAAFTRRGLQTAVSPLWGGMPFGGHLIVVERPLAAAKL
jgi:hypothetical protein